MLWTERQGGSGTRQTGRSFGSFGSCPVSYTHLDVYKRQGHTHVLKAEQMEGYILLNPGSVSIPKEGNPPTYAVLENGVFSIMDFEGNIVKSIVL